MLIHVLQWYEILPNLYKAHKDIFNPSNATWESVEDHNEFENPLDEKTIAIHRKNYAKNLTLVQLLQLFAHHYSDRRIMLQFRFNMRTGNLDPRTARDHPLTILDTYDERNPARSARSIHDLRETLTYMKGLLQFPNEHMFSHLKRFTAKKLYIYSHFSLDERGMNPFNMYAPIPPQFSIPRFLMHPGPYQNGKQYYRPNGAEPNYFAYPQPQINHSRNQMYSVVPSMPMAHAQFEQFSNSFEWPPLLPSHANTESDHK